MPERTSVVSAVSIVRAEETTLVPPPWTAFKKPWVLRRCNAARTETRLTFICSAN